MDIITDALFAPFQYGFMTRAFIVSALVGVMCPLLGAYVVTRGLGFMGDALAHSVLPGLAVAVILGATGASLFFGTIPVAIAVAVLIGYLAKNTGLSEDTSIGVLFAGLFALGLLILASEAARNSPVSVETALLGNVLGVTAGDVVVTSTMALIVTAVMVALHKELVFANFDPLGAAVIGLPTNLLDYALLVMMAVVIVIALNAVGVVLVISMLITPAAAAALLFRRFTWAMIGGAFIGAVSAVTGLYLSFHYNLASGPAMALVATTFFVLAAAYTWLARTELVPLLRGTNAG